MPEMLSPVVVAYQWERGVIVHYEVAGETCWSARGNASPGNGRIRRRIKPRSGGFPASGRMIRWRDMVMTRFEDGLIDENWTVRHYGTTTGEPLWPISN